MPESDQLPIYELIQTPNILTHLESEAREDVVRSLLKNLVDTGKITQAQLSHGVRGVNEREALGSTAIGGGVAIPHARVGFVDSPAIAYALLQDGQDFGPVDGGKIHHVFLLLTPKDDDAAHRSVLMAITRFSNVPIHLKALQGAKTPEDAHCVMKDYG